MSYRWLLYFGLFFLLHLLQLIAIYRIQKGLLEQHDYTDSILYALVVVICMGIGDIRNDIQNLKR